MYWKRRWGVRPIIRYRIFRRENSIFNKYLIGILIFLLIIYLFSLFDQRIKPTITSIANANASHIAVKVINEAINEKLAESNVKYEDLITFEKNNEGQITAFQSNIIKMNQLKSSLSMSVQQKISDIEWTQVNVPIGNIINSQLLAGWGPRIPVRLIPVGVVGADFKSSFQTAGINQTKHQISIELCGEIEILLPMIRSRSKVVTDIPIAETVIVGTVPNTYLNIKAPDTY